MGILSSSVCSYLGSFLKKMQRARTHPEEERKVVVSKKVMKEERKERSDDHQKESVTKPADKESISSLKESTASGTNDQRRKILQLLLDLTTGGGRGEAQNGLICQNNNQLIAGFDSFDEEGVVSNGDLQLVLGKLESILGKKS